MADRITNLELVQQSGAGQCNSFCVLPGDLRTLCILPLTEGVKKGVALFSSFGGILSRHYYRYTSTITFGTRSGNPDSTPKSERLSPVAPSKIWRHAGHSLEIIERQKGRHTMERGHIKRFWKWLWRKSPDELISGNAPKYKEPTGITWLNVHRLFDFRRWRNPRFTLFLRRRGITAAGRVNLSTPGRRDRTGASGSGV